MLLRRTGAIAPTAWLVLACLAVLLAAGCAPKLQPEPVWEKDARALLDQADGLFANRQFDQASKNLDAFLYQYPTSKARGRALYLMGEVRFIQRDYAKALPYYKKVIQEFPASSFIIPARYKLGQCYFELKEYDLAIANLEDRGRITDPAQKRRVAEILSAAYAARKDFPRAAKEYAYLAATAETDRQKTGYRDRVREIVDKNLTEQELRTLADETTYPADLARLRLAGILVEQRQFREAVKLAAGFLETFPVHPEKIRAEMLLNSATAGLTAPRYYLGALLPQSGQLSFFGDRVLKGIQLAVHQHNLQNPDNRVELLVRDTEGSPEKAAAALDELAAKGIVAAVGPLLTKEAEAIAPKLDKLKIPVITPAASGEGIGRLSPWLFRNALTNSNQAAAAARFALGLNLKKFVIFYPDDAYGKDLTRLFTQELERKAEILATVGYPPDVKDFGPYVKKIMEIDLRSRKVPLPENDAERKKLFQEYTPGFDALYLPGYAGQVGLLIPQLAFYNVTGIAVIGSNNWHSQDLLERAQRHAEGAVFVDGFFPESAEPAVKSVVDAYRSAYQEEPDILSAQAYDAAAMVLSFLKAGKDTPQAVRDALLALTDFSGITGVTSFAGTGEAQKKLFLIKIQDGKFALFSGGK
jgi:ABC-type branched-subunit amino acid transport system substrate-binding protein/outer membrane protein assembly factor BamD (BamD/ComL family)